MAKVPNPVPKGGRKPDAAFADNVGLWTPTSVAERAAPGSAKGRRPAGSGRLKISQCQPRNTAQRLKPEQARNTVGIPLQTHQPEPAPEILYIPGQWVNYYIARENEIVFY